MSVKQSAGWRVKSAVYVRLPTGNQSPELSHPTRRRHSIHRSELSHHSSPSALFPLHSVFRGDVTQSVRTNRLFCLRLQFGMWGRGSDEEPPTLSNVVEGTFEGHMPTCLL